ncbi:putative ribonuclease H-like domain-containing protein [Tanacetum coccineum]|uniref:Ribonuclease H-like domain-containing protein n=1 Tax=Tanacetum coccineum TaxID=301880 RepID=A0ABQ5CVD2_9ASTR
MENWISGLIAVKYISDPIIPLYEVSLTDLPAKSGSKLFGGTMGVFTKELLETLLGSKDFMMILELILLRITTAKRISTVRRIKMKIAYQDYLRLTDYDEVFAPVTRIEVIRLFLAYASFKDFVVYQMDVKSAFVYGKIEEEVYVCQPLGFEDPEFPDRVYKVEKALYGLHQALKACDILLVQVYVDDIIFGSTKKELCTEFEKLMHKKFQMSSMGELTFFLGLQVTQKDDGIFISQDKYVDEILKKFGFSTVKTASTPMETSKPLLKDAEVEDVDVHLYRSMIGSLMYLTSSRPDIMFVVCACARFQVTPKVSHLHAMKRIFRYLKGQPKLGLWYSKDLPFDLEAYFDSDYAGAIANSTTKAEYVAAASCCGQIQALVDGKKVIVTETSMRRALQLKDAEGTECLSNATIFVELERMGAKTTAWNKFSSTMASAIILFLDKQVEGMTKHKEIYVIPSHTKKLKNLGEGSEIPTDPQHTPTIIQPSTSQPQKKQPRRKQRKDTKVSQPSSSTEPITDEAANEEHVPMHSNVLLVATVI